MIIELFGPDHPSIGFALQKIGLVYERQGQIERAIDYKSRGLRIITAVYGKTHPDSIGAAASLAKALVKGKKTSEARILLTEVQEICHDNFGEEHRQTVEATAALIE
jgi:tetratricopeptide (TPR) repeat protein